MYHKPIGHAIAFKLLADKHFLDEKDINVFYHKRIPILREARFFVDNSNKTAVPVWGEDIGKGWIREYVGKYGGSIRGYDTTRLVMGIMHNCFRTYANSVKRGVKYKLVYPVRSERGSDVLLTHVTL